MIWARKGLVHLFSLILFVSLIGTALSVSANLAFSHPKKIETWLNNSNLYGQFVSNTTSQAIKAAGSSQNQASLTLGDSAVQQAANASFPTSLFQQSVNTFLESNYAWLEGKTSQPNFTIDLTSVKQSFASQVGQYVLTHMASLPTCTPQQLTQLGAAGNIDPLNITCRPGNLSAQAEASLVTQNIASSNKFLSNPVITANNINPNGSTHSRPYYQRFSKAPELYRLVVKLPWIYVAVVFLSTLAIIFIALRKRLGLRRVGIILTLAGLVLIAIKFLANPILKQIEKKLFQNSASEQIHQALIGFLNQAEHQLVKVYLWFGISFLILAIIIFLVLRFTRKGHKRLKVDSPVSTSNSVDISNRFRSDPQNSVPPARPIQRPIPTGPPEPPKRPPRLIQ